MMGSITDFHRKLREVPYKATLDERDAVCDEILAEQTKWRDRVAKNGWEKALQEILDKHRGAVMDGH